MFIGSILSLVLVATYGLVITLFLFIKSRPQISGKKVVTQDVIDAIGAFVFMGLRNSWLAQDASRYISTYAKLLQRAGIVDDAILMFELAIKSELNLSRNYWDLHELYLLRNRNKDSLNVLNSQLKVPGISECEQAQVRLRIQAIENGKVEILGPDNSSLRPAFAEQDGEFRLSYTWASFGPVSLIVTTIGIVAFLIFWMIVGGLWL